MPFVPPPIPTPPIRLRRTGARRGGLPESAPLTRSAFKGPQPKGKSVYVGLMVLVVVGGFFLQLNWLQRAKQDPANVAPNAFADKLGHWMLQTHGGENGGAAPAGAPGLENVECGNCLGTGHVLSETGGKAICPICQGVGYRLIRRFDAADRICPMCAGMGRVQLSPDGEVGTCPRCEGRGLIRDKAAAPAVPE